MPTDHLQEIPDEEKPRFMDQHTDDRIHQHLNNQNDEITEEDIRNVRIDIGENPLREIPPLSADNEAIREKESELPKAEDVKDNTEPDVETTWNILEP